MKKLDKDTQIAILWDQVMKLSEWTRQRDGQVQKGYGEMCKLENHGLIPHIMKEAHEAIGVEPPKEEPVIENVTVVEPIPEVPEVVEEIIEEVVEEVVEEVIEPKVEIVEPPEEEKPIESDNVEDLLQQYKEKFNVK